MDSSRHHWKVALLIAGLSSLVQSQLTSPANVPEREIAAKVGTPANLTCGSNGVPIISCIWERQNDKLTVNINSDYAVAGTTSNSAYGYVGGGFDAGTCGLLIKNVKEDDNSVWNCKLITFKGYLFQGDVRVGILKKPNKPAFSTNVDQIKNLSDPEETNVKVSVTCGSHGGQPPPKFKWYIGNEEIFDHLDPIESTMHNGDNWTHQTLTGHKFTSNDNGKDLRCVLVHEALSDSDFKEVAQKIVVNYGPKTESAIVTKFVPEMGRDVTLTVNISANPIPDKLVWHVGNTAILPMQTRDKYTAYKLVQISPGVYAAGLLIKNFEEEDLAKIYKLDASNLYGNATFDLRVSSHDPASGGGLSAGGIVGLVLGIPALLILIAVVVVYARARGLLCFKGIGEDSHSTAKIPGPNSDMGESGGNENPGNHDDGYPPPSETPPLHHNGGKYVNGNSNAPPLNGNFNAPPAPTIPPPPMDDHEVALNYENGVGRPVKDSPV